MAKRKRLSPASTDFLAAPGPPPETRAMPLGPAPIAQVAGEASARAALEEVAGEMSRARAEGRLILTLALDEIDQTYLVRDRLGVDGEELESLKESLRARGQQTPVEVAALPDGRYGLISGWRRLTALRRLAVETGDARFGKVQALLRKPETAAAAYVAMVEENEIRVGLSYYERARVAAKAVEQGAYPDEKAALLDLYAAASRPKRSKIRSFLTLYHAADDLLRFPAAIGERMGLALAKRIDETGAQTLRAALSVPAETAEAEQQRLQALLDGRIGTGAERGGAPTSGAPGDVSRKALSETPETGRAATAPAPRKTLVEVAEGVLVDWQDDSVVLTGPGVDGAFRDALAAWIRQYRHP